MYRLLVLLFITTLAYAKSSRQSDSLVLLSIKQSNQVIKGSSIEEWTPDLPIDQWSGVQLDETTGRVRGIAVKNCSLTLIPSEIQSLDSLKSLDLRCNKLDIQTIKPELVKFLNRFSGYNQDWALQQNIAYGGSRETDSLTLLELVRLNSWLGWDTTRPYGKWGNGIGFGGVNMDRVTLLNFYNSENSKHGQVLLRFPATIAQLSMLTTLYVEGSGVIPINGVDSTYQPSRGIIIDSLPSEFWKMPFLQTLRLSSVHFRTDKSEINNAKYLNKLSLAYTPFDTLPESLAELLSLDTLEVFFCNLKFIPTKVSSLKLGSLKVYMNHLFEENLSSSVLSWLNRNSPDWSDYQFHSSGSVIPKTQKSKRALAVSSNNSQLTFTEQLPQGTSLLIYDLKGRVVFQRAIDGVAVNIPGLSAGNYLVSIANRDIKITAKVRLTNSSER